jgi:hypothetical protein
MNTAKDCLIDASITSGVLSRYPVTRIHQRGDIIVRRIRAVLVRLSCRNTGIDVAIGPNCDSSSEIRNQIGDSLL